MFANYIYCQDDVIHESRENFVLRIFPSTWYWLEDIFVSLLQVYYYYMERVGNLQYHLFIRRSLLKCITMLGFYFLFVIYTNFPLK